MRGPLRRESLAWPGRSDAAGNALICPNEPDEDAPLGEQAAQNWSFCTQLPRYGAPVVSQK